MNTIKINKKNTLMIAHRGLSRLEKENTMASFIAAGNRSYFGMECDIHPTLDGRFVVIHDDSLLRVAGIDKNVEEMTLDEIKKINLIDNYNQKPMTHLLVPTLEEYLECCIKYEKKCIIEFKNLFKESDIIKVLNIVNSYEYLDNCIFISFYLDNLKIVRKYQPNTSVQFLLSSYNEELIKEIEMHKIDLDINYHAIDEEKIKYLHSKNIKINVWTVNDKEVAEKLTSYGIDYITTDVLE